MRLLFDENLSRNLCNRLSDVLPKSQHIAMRGLERASDLDVWTFAKLNGLTIVTKDSDYHQMSFLYGAPPKVIWLRVGNCSTEMVENVIRRNLGALSELDADDNAAILVLDLQ